MEGWGVGGGGVGGEKREVVRYVEMWRDGGGGRSEVSVREGGELEKVRHRLTETQKQHDELCQKYIAVSERVSGCSKKESVSRLKLSFNYIVAHTNRYFSTHMYNIIHIYNVHVL